MNATLAAQPSRERTSTGVVPTIPLASGGAFVPPEEFDDYVILQPLGGGAMGQVFLAEDTVLARHVAIKFIGALEPDARARQQLLIEARAAARIQHPNVVAIYRVAELDDHPYLVTEFVRGESLERLAKPVAWARALSIGVDLARGLAAAHRRGVLHCDIKTANAILAEDGTAKLLDFGLAKLLQARADDGADARGDAEDGERDAFVQGTPDTMAPEIWRAEPPTRRSDVYSLGAVLYELVTGHPPFAHVAMDGLARAVNTLDAPPLAVAAAACDPRFAAIVDRCLARDPAQRFASGDDLRAALEELSRNASGGAIPRGNPYRGLRAFEAEHRALFFGRGPEIGVVLDRLRAESFVLVTGESGVGKSSLCRAGVLPLAAEGALGDGRAWSVVSFAPGRRPLAALVAAVASALQMDAPALELRLREQPTQLAPELARLLGRGRGLLIFVDQIEELVTASDPREADLVARALGALAERTPGVRLFATLRADFLARFAALPGLGEDLSRVLYFLRPLSSERVRDVVTRPAMAAGARFESDALVDLLVESTAHAQSGLPLLQFALSELWDRRADAGDVITMASLEAMGGVAGALARHGDAVLASMSAAARVAARHLLARLVTAEGTRQERTEAELGAEGPGAREALNALVAGRILVAHDAEVGSAFALAHDVLVRGWPTLRAWLEEDADGRVVRDRLAAAAGDWDRLKRAPEALWSARRLDELSELSASLLPLEARFVSASRAAVRRAKWKRGALLAALPLVALSVYAGVALRARAQLASEVAIPLAEARTALAEAEGAREAARAAEQLAFQRFDARDREAGEKAWARALELGSAAERATARAGLHLEAAIAKDPSREDARGMLADVLLQRALVAEHARRPEARDDLIERLALYDTGGARMRRWRAGAALEITTTPPGATVTLERYTDGPDQSLHLEPVGSLGVTPIASTSLARGSYRLTFDAPGRPIVRYPVLAERDGRLSIHAELPRDDETPPGFVFVPAGRFLFGSGADEQARRGFFDTVPIHPMATGSYFIATHEVTFGDWIAYLDDLSGEERAPRLPHVVAKVGAGGGLEVARALDGLYTITMQPEAGTTTAAAGRPLSFPHRDRRALQDWSRLPVTAISAEDAQAYTAWLAATGRVSGARLCTEGEWERAARGADAREYPHGGGLLPDDANFDATYGKEGMGLDEIGTHPASRSPFGLDDMCGNAFEWTASTLDDGQFVARGGAYAYDPKTDQLVNRNVSSSNLHDAALGLRVCVTHAPPRP